MSWRLRAEAERERRKRARERTGLQPGRVPEFRGAALELQTCEHPEVMIAGPAETGKTFAALYYLHTLCLRYPGAQMAMVRKVATELFGTAYQTYLRKVLPLTPGVRVIPFGGNRPEWIDYDNGSRIYLGGMDKPGKVLSAERDVIYANQAEQLDLADWETMTTRTTGRAGNMPWGGLLGDANPGGSKHWILERERDGHLLRLNSHHEDNPSLFGADGSMTEQGRKTLAVLDRLTGIRHARLRLGLWKSAEGTVYEFDPEVHLVDPFAVPDGWQRFRVVDFGYKNPFVCQWWALDYDARMVLYRELYMTGRLVEDHAKQIVTLSQGEDILTTICDHDAEGRATLERYGIETEPANKLIVEGIQAVQARLRVEGDGRPRLMVMRGALVERDESLVTVRRPASTEEEFEAYVWPHDQQGRSVKEQPVKEFDHGMDAMRYGVMAVEGGQLTRRKSENLGAILASYRG